MIKDDRTFEERLEHLRKGLEELCKYDRIEVLPVIASTPQAIVAQIRFIDLNNKEVLKRYGLEPIEDKAVDAPVEEDTPSNPLRN